MQDQWLALFRVLQDVIHDAYANPLLFCAAVGREQKAYLGHEAFQQLHGSIAKLLQYRAQTILHLIKQIFL